MERFKVPDSQYASTCAMLYKTGTLEITSDVRSKPLGQKRRRGRPKKIPHCLQKSPEPRTVGSVAQASYINPSPDVSLIISDQTSSPHPRMINVIPFIPPDSPPVSRSQTPSPVTIASSPAVTSPQAPVVSPSPPVIRTTRSKRQREAAEPDLPPPAKRISRQTVKLTFVKKGNEMIVNVKQSRS